MIDENNPMGNNMLENHVLQQSTFAAQQLDR